MCIIAYKPAGISIDRKTLRTCFDNNPDGAGYMYPCEGKVLISKGYWRFKDFWSSWEKTLKIHGESFPVVFHFRIATAGCVDKRNCHPHRITKDLAFVHNGILTNVTVPKDSPVSDTIIYRDKYLRRLKAESIYSTDAIAKIGDHIGTGNKFVFMNGYGHAAIANESAGVWAGNVWYSNTSFKPRFSSNYFFDEACEGDYCEYCGKALDDTDEKMIGLCWACAEAEEWNDLSIDDGDGRIKIDYKF